MSNVRFQEALWLGKIPGLTHSFSELICNLGDYAIPEGLSDLIEMGITDSKEAENFRLISEKIDSLLSKHPDIFE